MSKHIDIKDINTTAKRLRLLGREIFERCKMGLEGGVTLPMLQSRSCQLNNDLGTNFSANDLIDLCGLRQHYKDFYPDLCCYCVQDTGVVTYRMNPCKHLLHAQCIRQFHENRLRGYHKESSFYFTEPDDVVLCPVCHDPLQISTNQLFQATIIPTEFGRVKRKKQELPLPDEEAMYEESDNKRKPN
jgi:hypothetical protein